MPKFKTGDKIALAKVEYRTVLEVVEASEHEYYIQRPYRPFESCMLSHSVYDIDNNYELVKPRESETEIHALYAPVVKFRDSVDEALHLYDRKMVTLGGALELIVNARSALAAIKEVKG